MKSKNSDTSQEKIRKATELLHKIWWFSFFLIIAPLIVAIAIFAILNFVGIGLFTILSLSVVGFMFALLFFYKAFDKYRDNPFFLNKKNNLTARIHVFFLISILSFITTPLFILISPWDSFIYLPLISYIILFNIVYYYYYYQPIDFFDLKAEEFKHAKSLELMIKQPYNFLVFINYIIHIIFLSFTASTNFAWLYALITNTIIYFITLSSTRSQVKNIIESINRKKPILKELTAFKRRIVSSQIILIFILLIQIPFIVIFTIVLAGEPFLSLTVINNLFLVLIFILFYFKSRFYVSFHYKSKIKFYDNSEIVEPTSEETRSEIIKYQKFNSILSGILILLISLYSFLTGKPFLIIIILPFIYILLHYEQKAGLCSKIYNKYVILLNSIAILVYFSFGLIPVLIGTVLLNFLVFCLALYFVLQIFVKLNYFIKENIIIYQNLLAVASFSLVLYTFFPVAIFGYTTFTSNPIVILVSNILLHSVFILVILLVSQYVLGVRYFQVRTPKLFKKLVLINGLLIELLIITFINFRIYYLIELIPFLQVLCIWSIFLPIIFLVFLFLNYSFHVFTKEYILQHSYFSLWFLLIDLFISLLIISIITGYLLILAFDFLVASIFYFFLIKFGLSLERVMESKFKKYVKINSYVITIELLYLFFNLFYTIFLFLSLFDNILYSIFLSLASVCIIINLFSKKGLFSEDLYIKINVFVLLYGVLIAFYYFLMLTLHTLYIFIVPLMVSSIILFLPLLYLRKKRLYPSLISKSIKINSILLSVTLSLIPATVGLQLFILGIYFDIIFLVMTVINFTLYILLTIFRIYYLILKNLENREKRVKFFLKSQIIFVFCISFTTVFYYLFFFLINTLYIIVIPLILTFSFLFIPFFYSFKKEIFTLESTKKVIISNMVILTGLFTSIPTLIGINLLNIGLIFDLNLFILNILNFSVYIFYIFLSILIRVSNKLKIKENFVLFLKQLQIITIFCMSITTVFFYPFLLLFGTFYGIILPLIALLFSWFFLFYYSYKREYFDLEKTKKLTIYNFIALSSLIISIPTIISLELAKIGLIPNLFLTITSTCFIVFCFLKISEIISIRIKLKEKFIKIFKNSELIVWFSFTLLLSFYFASVFIIRLEMTPFTCLILSCSFFIFFVLSLYTLYLASNISTKLPNLIRFQDIIIYAIILSISSIFTFLILSTYIFAFLNSLPILFANSILVGFFFIIFIVALIFFNNIYTMKLTQVKAIIELTAWVVIKIIICILLFSLIEYFVYQFYILNKFSLFALIFAFLTPLSLNILKELRHISSKNQFLIKKITVIVFALSLLSVYLEILLYLTLQMPIFYQNPSFHLVTIIINIILIFFYNFTRFNKVVENDTVLKLFNFYFVSFILSISLLYFNSILFLFQIIIFWLLILSRRSLFPIFRFLSYFLLSYVTFVEILIVLSFYGIITGFDIALTGIFIIIYLLSTIGVSFFSILLNIKKNNTLEKWLLYSLISICSFISLSMFTNILLIYNVTISLFIMLLFLGISFYRRKDERYKWFINPCVILFVFDFISFISSALLFNNPTFRFYNPILTFTLTLSMTGFAFVLLYNKAPARFRKKSFYIVLIAIVISFPTFLYFLIIAALSMPLWSLVPLITSINFGVFLFYLSIGIYQWKVSWAIWKSGWYVWNILPIVNWFIIYQSLTGMDIFTTELWRIGPFELGGAFFLSLIISSLFFIPVVYSKIKKYFSLIVFTIWGESLFLLYWFSQNLFVTDLLLRNLFFIMFSVTLLMPLLVIFKFWKIISILWIFPLTFTNALFLLFYLTSIGLSLEITISIDILVIGLFLIVYSFFPNIRSIGLVLICAYLTTLIGIFLTLYFILYAVIQHLIFSLNISLLVFGFTLFSSKYLKLPKRTIDLCLSWILIINFSWLTFNTFYFFLGYLIFALSLALTVFGCSFFIFNRYKMRITINKIFPYLTVAVGASLSITSLTSILFQAPIGVLVTVFSTVFIIFLYRIFTDYRYILWFMIPIPIISPILEWIITLDIMYPSWILAFLTWPMFYLLTFQILINIFKSSIKKETTEIKNSLFKLYQDKNQLRWLNFMCFLINSVCISLFLTIIIPNLFMPILFTEIIFVYQICDFLIIWPFLFLICMKYIEKSELNIKIKDKLRYFSILSTILYLFIPSSLGINIILYLIFINADLVISTYMVILTTSALAFFEIIFVDRFIFKFLINSTRNQLTLCFWFIFCNTLSLFIYMFHLNIFLLVFAFSVLNLVSLHFLSNMDISREIIIKLRLLLIYNSFIWSSFFIASLISEGLALLFTQLRGIGYFLLLFQNSSLFLYILSRLFMKIEKNIKIRVEFILFIIFQGLIAISLAYIFTLFNFLNFISINLIIFIELCFSFVSVKNFNIIIAQQKYPNFLLKIHSLMVLILYFEISIMIYGLVSMFIGIFESIMVALLILFILTILDIYSIKKVKISYATLIHTISYFILSLNFFLFLHSFVSQIPFLLSLEILIFLIMQFYTNYSLFKSLKLIFPDKKDVYNKAQTFIHRLIGAGFYTTLCYSIIHPLVLQGFNIELILLILSLVIHVLMIMDSFLFKFLGKITDYIKSISWILIMIFTSTYLIWIYSTYFIAFFLTVIPVIIIILILEFAYLFKLLSYWKVIASYKNKIKSGLIIISYLNFISWPLYFSSLNQFANLNLVLASFFIMFLITLLDKVVNEKLRKSLRSFSFLIIGALLSVDLFLGLLGIPNFDFILNLSSSSLIFMIFLAINIRPFKKHSSFASRAFLFWLVIFILLFLIVYRVSSLGLGFAVLGFGILLYPFIFLLEELKRFINNIVDYLSRFFIALKLAIKKAFIKIFQFIKLHYKALWTLFSIFISILIGFSLSPAGGNVLGWTHSILLIFPIFGILYSIIPSKKSDDVNIMFRRRMLRLIISWGSIIILLFAVITPVWYIFTFWIAIWILGAILLPYIIYKERNDNISIKWRFYTLIFLIILLIGLGIPVIIQIIVNFIL